MLNNMEYLVALFFIIMFAVVVIGGLLVLGGCLFASTGDFMDRYF